MFTDELHPDFNKGCRFCYLKVWRYFQNNHCFAPLFTNSAIIPLGFKCDSSPSISLVHLLAATTSQEKHSPTWLFKLNLFTTPQLINTCPGSAWRKTALSLEISILTLNPRKEQSKFIPAGLIARKVILQRWKSAERLTLLYQLECPG